MRAYLTLKMVFTIYGGKVKGLTDTVKLLIKKGSIPTLGDGTLMT